MNILNDVVKGAVTQFGREFGRAGANTILKGANSYTIKSASDYTGRIKPSDTAIVKTIKEMNKIKFATTNKANVSRLIELTDLTLRFTKFEGNETLNQLDDFKDLLEIYDNKFEHGSALLDDNYEDKSVDYLNTKRNELVDSMNNMNAESKEFIANNLEHAKAKIKSKQIATLLAIPPLGGFGIHKFYLGKIGTGFLYLLFFWTFIPPLVAIIEIFIFLSMSKEKFDIEFNPEFAYYNQFNVGN